VPDVPEFGQTSVVIVAAVVGSGVRIHGSINPDVPPGVNPGWINRLTD
jgi:hypothetical protein